MCLCLLITHHVCRVLAVSWHHKFGEAEPCLACGWTAVVALMAIKTELEDPYNVLDNWDINSVDPCSWRMVTCSSDGYVSALYVTLPCSCPFWGAPAVAAFGRSSHMRSFVCRGLPSQSLSGKLSPGIGNLTKLQSVLVYSPPYCLPIALQNSNLRFSEWSNLVEWIEVLCYADRQAVTEQCDFWPYSWYDRKAGDAKDSWHVR